MSSPDVRVRLTPQGVAEVIAALKKVVNEGKRANKESAKGVGVLTAAVKDLKRFLPALGVGAVVAGVVGLGRQALITADQMGKLADITGSSVENFSIFASVADKAGASLQEQRGGLNRLAQNLQRLREGNTQTADSFARLNLAAEDFAGLDTVEAAFKLAEALAAIEDPAKRTALAKATLGEAGARLIPTLLDLADKGFAGARKEAEALGIVISDELSRDATAANDAMGALGKQVRGLALSFISDLAPQITAAMTTVSDETQGKGLNAVRLFGKGVGLVIGAIINIFRLMATVIGGTLEIVGTSIASVLAATNQALRLNFSEAKTILAEGFKDIDRINREASAKIVTDLKDLLHDLTNDPPPPPPRRPVADDDDGEDQIAADQALTKARLAAAKARAAAELALQKEYLQAESEANQRAYDQGLLSLQQFSDKRREIIERQAALEIAALKAQRDAIAASVNTAAVGPSADAARLQARTEIADLENQILIRQLASAREIADIEGDRIKSAKALAAEQRKTANDLDELEGRRHAVFARNLEQEIKEVRRLGRQAGQSAAEIEAIVQRLSSARTSRFNFDETTRAGAQALEAFQRDAQQIRLDQEAGVISQLEGELRLIELQRQRLGTLRELAAAAQEAAAATGDPELIARALAYAQSVDQIAASFTAATDTAAQLRSASIEAFEGGLSELLGSIQDVESLEDAFKSLARTVAATMQKIAAEILARQAVFALLRAFGGGGAAVGSAVATGWTGGYIRGYAGGGDIRGPQLPIAGPDKIPILAAKGEFMLRRSAVAEPGALDFLRRWNAGHFSLRQAMQLPRFAAGGLVGAEAPAGGPLTDGSERRTRIVNVLDPRMAVDAMNTAAGEDVILNVIDRNSEKIRTRLGG